MIVTTVLYLIGLACIVGTLLPLSTHEAWWIRACDFPRLQVVAISVGVLGLLVAFGRMDDTAGLLLGLALLGCIAYQLTVILPYTRLWRAQIQANRAPPGDQTLSLLVVNVLMPNRRAEKLLTLIRRRAPDVVLALETDHWWCEHFEQLTKDYPFRLVHPLDNTYGLLLYSKLELIEPELRFLLIPDVPSVRAGLRLRSGAAATLHCLHPEPPSPTESDSSAPRDAELVLVAREVAEKSGPTIVAGDLNDVAWSHTSRLFRRISRLLDPRIGRGMFNTFHAEYWPLRWPLDHVFISSDFLLRTIQRLPAFGSDHFPILITLDHAPRAVEAHDPPDADSDDQAEADEKLEQVGVDPDHPSGQPAFGSAVPVSARSAQGTLPT